MSFSTRVPRQLNEERTMFSTNGAGAVSYLHAERTTLEPFLTLDTKFNSKCIIDVNRRFETVKLLGHPAGSLRRGCPS